MRPRLDHLARRRQAGAGRRLSRCRRNGRRGARVGDAATAPDVGLACGNAAHARCSTATTAQSAPTTCRPTPSRKGCGRPHTISSARPPPVAEERGAEQVAAPRRAHRPQHDVAEADEPHREAEMILETIHVPALHRARSRGARLRHALTKILRELSTNRGCPRQQMPMLSGRLTRSSRLGPHCEPKMPAPVSRRARPASSSARACRRVAPPRDRRGTRRSWSGTRALR